MKLFHSALDRSWSPALLTVLALALVAAACGGGGGGGPTSPGVLSDSQIEYTSFSLANDARSSNHVQPMLSLEQTVTEVARAHSEAMRDHNFFSHNGVDGSLATRLRAAGLSFSVAGENLAKVTASGDPAQLAHSQFLQSPSHMDTMLDSRFQVVGVGVARAGDTFWLTQIYIRP